MSSVNPRLFNLPPKKMNEDKEKVLKSSNLLLTHLHQQYLNLHKPINQEKK